MKMYDAVFAATISKTSLLHGLMDQWRFGSRQMCRSRLLRFSGAPQVCRGQDCGRPASRICCRESEDDVPGGHINFGVPTVLHKRAAQRLAN